MKQSKGVFRRIASVLLALLLSLTTLLPAQKALAAKDLTPHLKIDEFKVVSAITKEELKEFHSVPGKTEQEIGLSGRYSFPTLGEGDIKEGDYFTITPNTPLGVSDGTYKLMDEGGTEEMGTLVASKATNTLTFTFNNKIENKTHVRGSFFTFGIMTYTTIGKVTITVPGGFTQEITIKPPHGGDTFENEKLVKSGYGRPNLDYLQWGLRINRNGNAGNARVVVKDRIKLDQGSLATFKPESFTLLEVRWHHPEQNAGQYTTVQKMKVTQNPAEFDNGLTTALLKLTEGGTAFEVDLGTQVGTRSFKLDYRTTSPRDGTKVVNSAGVTWDGVPQTTYTKKEW